jgi:hypothetical protein
LTEQYILGDKYGYRPFPPAIDQIEFETILENLKTKGSDISPLIRCFRLDLNAVPPQYILLSIRSIYPLYRSDNADEHRAASGMV